MKHELCLSVVHVQAGMSTTKLHVQLIHPLNAACTTKKSAISDENDPALNKMTASVENGDRCTHAQHTAARQKQAGQ
jgi:hypothetical protein